MAQLLSKRLLILCGCTIFSVGIIALLYLDYYKKAHVANGFKRLFAKVIIKPTGEFHSKYSGFYLAGNSTTKLYFGNYTTPLYVLQTDLRFLDTATFHLTLQNINHYYWKKLVLTIDSPSVYSSEGITPVVLAGDLKNKELSPAGTSTANFLDAIPLSVNTIIARKYDSALEQATLIKQWNDKPLPENSPTVLEKQIDGVFCTDGMLLFNKETALLVYLYYYRNQFIVLDTNLQTILKARTIDTNQFAKISVKSLVADQSSVMDAPRFLVNSRSAMDNEHLFVNSTLIADNEARKAFYAHAVCDRYSLKDGRYINSFYLPNLHNQKPDQFYIINHTLICIYPNWIGVFSFDLK